MIYHVISECKMKRLILLGRVGLVYFEALIVMRCMEL
jgi:hypothetical protein